MDRTEPRPRRAAFSLLEVLVSLALVAAALAVMMQFLVAGHRTSIRAGERLELLKDGETALATIAHDIEHAQWIVRPPRFYGPSPDHGRSGSCIGLRMFCDPDRGGNPRALYRTDGLVEYLSEESPGVEPGYALVRRSHPSGGAAEKRILLAGVLNRPVLFEVGARDGAYVTITLELARRGSAPDASPLHLERTACVYSQSR